jgi:autotransporter-associated beta strand protein
MFRNKTIGNLSLPKYIPFTMRSLLYKLAIALLFLSSAFVAFAKIPGGGDGTGPNVAIIVNNGNGTVTMSNGIVSILCTTAGATINQINYTYNNSGTTVTTPLLNGGTDGGMLYWETGGFGTGGFNFSVVSNNADYCEIDLLSTSSTNGTMDVHFSMLRGSPGFYVTAIFSHRSADVAMNMGETRDNIYAGSIFNWMSVDSARNKLMEVQPTAGALGVLGAPVEVSLWTNGIYQGRYEDKYKYSADFGVQRVWGWSSVGNGGDNVGLWQVSASAEYYSNGPMKRDLMSHIGTTILNYFETSHYGGAGTDGNWRNGEVWSKVYGPYFIYCNNITNAITATNQAAQMLYTDALAQAAAEAPAWPYSWFGNTNYASSSQRGTVAGQMAINDIYNPNASPANLWVGVIQQPVTIDGIYDFQQWMKTCQFWTKTDTNGNFTIPNVIAGTNYTLYAFGPGAAGTFQSQVLIGGFFTNTADLPASQFSINVTGGATNSLGTVTWTPTRVGPTVFEIGYPDRTGAKFRHGEDYWVGDIGPSPTEPMPIWSKFLEYPFDFPNGPNYTVGQSRWTTDWNFVQPAVGDLSGNFNGSTSTINFNLATAPAGGAMASIYIGLASSYQGALIVSANGNNLGTAAGATSVPNPNGVTGFFTAYSGANSESDTTTREGINSVFSDERITFPASLLNVGENTITINMRKSGSSEYHAMYDYIRLELTGYVPPPPASVAAYPGNNCNLVCWPVTPGATSYNILRSMTSGSGYLPVTNGVTGPVCGSGLDNATYLDTSAVNGTIYYYVVQSANPGNSSTNSPQSAGVTPSSGLSTSPPVAPTGLAVAAVAHQSVTLNWNASSGANYYTILRSTLYDNGGGASNVLNTIVLHNNVTSTSYTDASPTDGSIYSYSVIANSAGGASGASAPAAGIPLPAPPSSAPGSFTGSFVSTEVFLTWSPVPNAVGYIVSRSTAASGPFAYLMSVTETNYLDTDPTLSTNTSYFYQVTAVNTAGVSASARAVVLGAPRAPGLSAVPGDTQISLTWSAIPAATNYVLQSSITNGGPYAVILDTPNTTYINTNLTNGTTYYYVVYSQGPNGQSPLSAQASATPSVFGASGIYWTNAVTALAQSWNVNANWINSSAFPNGAQSQAIVNSAISGNQTIDLNQAITVGSLSLGSGGGIFTVAANSGTLTFDNAGTPTTLIELPTSLGDNISAPMSVNGTLLVSNTTANTLSLSGNISSGTINLTGNTILNGANTYAGGTILNSGLLTFEVASAIPGSGTLTLNGAGTVKVVTANSLPNVLINGANSITGNGNSGTGIATLNDAGLLTLFVSGGSDVFDLTGTMTGSGTLALGTSAMTLRFNGTGGDGNAVFNLGTGTSVANVRNTGTTGISLGGLIGGAKTQLQGDNSGGGANMTYTIGGANANSEFDGAIVNGTVGTVAVSKTGSGTLVLTGTNNYSAGTTINGGTLLVNNAKGSGTGLGTVAVNLSGSLGGTGIISGAVTVNSGGALAPGNPLGTLTISNNLTLAASSTVFMQVQHLPLTNDSVKVSGTLTEGGTLNVTNFNGTTFVVGDSFKLFNAGTYSGAFNNFILPPLSAGLGWNTSALNASGTLSVVTLSSPTITSAKILNGSLVVSGTGGLANWPYYVLNATNLVSPQWVPIATNQFDGSGNFVFTNAINPLWPQSYYLLQLP